MGTQVQILGPGFSNFVRTVMLCCEEKGVSYRTGFELDGEVIARKSDAHLYYHPYGKVPVLKHGDRHLFETCTICRYIDSAFEGPALQPEDPWNRAWVDQCAAELALYIDDATVRKLLLELAFPKGEGGSVRMDRVEAALPKARQALERIEHLLGDKPFIAAQSYTMADALATPILDYMARLPMAGDLIPTDSALHGYLAAMRERASGQAVLAPVTLPAAG